MQGSFEKDVQQKLDELRLTPSVPVWEKIELEIREEKKKRRGLFWLLPLALLLAGGGWWLFRSTPKESAVAQQTAHRSEGTRKLDSSPIPETQTKPPSTNKSLPETLQPLQKPARKNRVALWSEKKELVTPFAGTANRKEKNRQATEANANAFAASFTKEQAGEKQAIAAQTVPVPERNQSSFAARETNAPEERQTQALPAKADSAGGAKTTEESKPPTTDTATKKKAARAGKWRKQAVFGAGINTFAQTRQRGLVASPLFNSPSTGSVAPSLPGTATALEPGVGLAAGFSLVKNLGRHWELSLGLQYSYASVRQAVGNETRADTALFFAQSRISTGRFFTNTGKTTYANRYHVVEFPVGLTYKTAGAVPVCFSAGVAYGRLLRTNALTFNSGSNLYYRNKANDNRHLLPLSSSVQVEFFSKKKTSLRTGPFVQYHLLTLQKESTGNTSRLLFAGLKTTVNF